LSANGYDINMGTYTITDTKVGQWDTAYSWGDHSTAGYLTSFTETDPTVPSHVKSITTTEKANWNTAYGWGNHATAGYAVGTVSESASNSTIVQRNSSGYIFANYFNTTPNDVTSGVTKVCVETGNDGYIRHGTPAAIASFISGQSMNISGSSTSCSGVSSQVTINYNNNSNSSYQLLWGSGNSVYGTASVYLNPSTNYVYASSFNCGDWFRSTGATGWYNGTYSGGIYMQDTTWVRVYNSKAFYVANQIAATGNITAYYSDERLKERTGSIDNALDKVCSLSGFYYVNNDVAKENGYTDEKQQLGLSAQEVQSQFPEVVTLAPFDMETDEFTGEVKSKSGEDYLTLDYSKLVPVLVEAIKELKAEIEELKNGSSN